MMVLESPMLTVDGLPPIDLSQNMLQPGLRYDPDVGGYPVWLFSDLRRHDMDRRTPPSTLQRGVALTQYLTRGCGASPIRRPTCTTPGTQPRLRDRRHDGEGAAARAAFAALAPAEKRLAAGLPHVAATDAARDGSLNRRGAIRAAARRGRLLRRPASRRPDGGAS